MIYKTELQVTESLVKFLIGEGYQVRTEISNMGQSIDVIAIYGDEMVTAIEVKRLLGGWKRGVAQCKAHELVADYIALAIGTTHGCSALSVAIRRKGYGLLLLDEGNGKWRWVELPRRNWRIFQAQRKRFLENLNTVPEEVAA